MKKYLRIVFFAVMGLIVIGILSVRFYNRNLMTVTSESMMPTLAPLEVIEVDRGAFEKRDPEPGEVVLYLVEKDQSSPSVGRIVGVPGDRIAFSKGRLSVNYKPVQVGVELAQNKNILMEQVTESLNGREYQIWNVVAADPGSDATAQINKNEYYILGDHRSHSKDSRFFGKIPKENIVGAVLRIQSSHDQSRIGRPLAL